ncbi:MAG TPA: DegV family protein [Gaiellaceae bacterium]|nr:DegV family protein [Gaiellaceae bacterium]
MNLDAGNTAIVLDSTADFPDARERHPNFRVVPLYVRFGDQSFRDYVDLGAEEFYARLREAPELPTTSQPTPGDFLAVYEELAGYERILVLTIASSFSGTFESARTAAELEGSGRVRVLDSRTASAAIALLALAIQRRLERGTTDEEVDALVERFTRENGLLFTVSTLDWLARGGRIGKAAAFAGNLLNVKPILGIHDGAIEPLKRVRGNQKAFLEFRDRFVAATSDDASLRVGIAHAAAPERLRALTELVEHVRPQATVELPTTLGPVVGTHAGPGTVGFFWFQDRV